MTAPIDPLTGGRLQQYYGPEPSTYYAGSHLNRVSFLRDDYKFLNLAVNHPQTRFLVLDNLNPPLLVIPGSEDITSSKVEQWNEPRHAQQTISFLTRSSSPAIAEFIGNPFETEEVTQIENWDSKRDALGADEKPLIVFLGLDTSADPANAVSYQKKDQDGTTHVGEVYKGQAYFAVDASSAYLKSEVLQSRAKAVLESPDLVKATYKLGRFQIRLSPSEASLYAQARMYVDWNARNRFCGGCGVPNMSVNGGCKLTCPGKDAGIDLPPCPTRGTISNLSFPRTDSSVIAAIVNYAGDKMLLGRNRRFPPGFFSCLAGFMEPAETVEDCVRREIWEESGVTVGRVIIHSTQPWPFPANIMIGCIGQVIDDSEAAHAIHLGHDPELEECSWYDIKKLSAAVELASQGSMGQRPVGLAEGQPQLPPPEAIAFTLIEAITSGRVKGLNV